jgi:hypothetical protein
MLACWSKMVTPQSVRRGRNRAVSQPDFDSGSSQIGKAFITDTFELNVESDPRLGIASDARDRGNKGVVSADFAGRQQFAAAPVGTVKASCRARQIPVGANLAQPNHRRQCSSHRLLWLTLIALPTASGA